MARAQTRAAITLRFSRLEHVAQYGTDHATSIGVPDTLIDSSRPRSLRVLVVDDHASCRTLARSFAERHGHHVDAVTNGRDALAAITRTHYDVVLMDVAMPELDGIEATRIIRARERESGTRLRIVAMTASTVATDRARCLAAGMDAYLAKPLSDADVARALLTASGRPVLIVDDNAAVRHALVAFLRLRGYETVTADNGAAALALLPTLPIQPGIILLDLMMPVMDGVTFRQVLLADHPEYATIPTVVISAVGELIDTDALSPAASLAKPFDPDALLAIVAAHCGPPAQRAATEHVAWPTTTTATPTFAATT
jgi:CheY-like chemotaxis protein